MLPSDVKGSTQSEKGGQPTKMESMKLFSSQSP